MRALWYPLGPDLWNRSAGPFVLGRRATAARTPRIALWRKDQHALIIVPEEFGYSNRLVADQPLSDSGGIIAPAQITLGGGPKVVESS
jgi:hypothetical protein